MQLAPFEAARAALEADRDDMWTAGLPLHAQCCGHPLDTSVLSATDADGHFSHATRPIATPCRAVRPNLPTLHTQRGHSTSSSPDAEHRAHSVSVNGTASSEWLGCTLLEQSVRRADSVAFYLARTLVEVLVEHFGTHAHTSPSGGRVLRLYDHLSLGQHFDMSTVNFQLGLSLDDVLPHFRPAQWSLTRTIPQGLSLHPSAEIFRYLAELPLPVLPAPDHRPWETIEVCTDGSFDGGRSSWAFLVIGWHRGACHVIGWCAGPVVTDSTAVMHIGAGSHDAFRGELSGPLLGLGLASTRGHEDLCSDLV